MSIPSPSSSSSSTAATPFPPLTATSPKDWAYVAEGASSLVCTSRGPQSPFLGYVLRLHKDTLISSNQPTSANRGQDEEQIDTLAWQAHVIRPLLPPNSIPQLSRVLLDPAWLAQLSQLVESSRPPFRRAVDRVDLAATAALMAPDLIGSEGLAVEIKPKWGFMPDPRWLSDTTRELKTRYCRNCMLRAVRALSTPSTSAGPARQEQTWERRYCPLDLFSGDEGRVRKALEGMWDEWIVTRGQGNVFRVFNEGKRVDPTSVGALEELTRTLGADDAKQPLIDRLLPALLNSPILSRLKHLQRTLDPYNIEGLSAMLRSLPPPAEASVMQTEPTLEEWHAFVLAYQSGQEPADEMARARYWLLAYALSAVFKDCSIIVGLPAAHPRPTEPAPISWVIDTDAKPVRRFEKWLKQDQEICEAFKGLEVGWTCQE